MKKIQHLSLEFSSSNNFQQPFYCPFSGQLLILPDPNNEVEEFPKTVIAVFTENGSNFLRDDFYESGIENFDDMEDLYKILEKKVSSNSGILIVEIGYLDYGAWIFILEIPNVFIQ